MIKSDKKWLCDYDKGNETFNEKLEQEWWDYPNADKLDWNNAKDDIGHLLFHVKKLEESRNYWARVCKEAQELRDINGADLKKAESYIKELEKDIENKWPVIRGMKKIMDYEADVRHKQEKKIKELEDGIKKALELIEWIREKITDKVVRD